MEFRDESLPATQNFAEVAAAPRGRRNLRGAIIHPTTMSPTTSTAAAFAASTGRVAAVSGANKGVGFFIGE